MAIPHVFGQYNQIHVKSPQGAHIARILPACRAPLHTSLRLPLVRLQPAVCCAGIHSAGY
jgi:hypothetical protein